MEIKRNILFFPEKEKGKNDAKLRMRIRWGKNVVNINVGHRIYPDKWLKDAQRCKRNTSNLKKVSASVINSEIQRLHDKAEDVFKAYEVKEYIPKVDEFRTDFKKAIGKKLTVNKVNNFYTYFDAFVTEEGRRNLWKEATFKKFKTIRNHLELFNPDLRYEQLNENRLTDLVYFLRSEKDYRDSTIEKFFRFLKWYLKWSTRKKYNVTLDFETFKPKLRNSKQTIIYLHWDELMSIYNKKIPKEKEHLDKVRDVFCFCCFTSLRYSDVANLKKSDIHNNHIEITTIKTADTLTIDLNNYSRAILEKYNSYKSVNNEAFPVISNQKMNDRLKDLAKFCDLTRQISQTYFKGNERFDEVNKLCDVISTHVARKTFISNALIMGIPPQTVMQWTGHSDYSAMKPYIAIADKDRAKAMEMFNR